MFLLSIAYIIIIMLYLCRNTFDNDGFIKLYYIKYILVPIAA